MFTNFYWSMTTKVRTRAFVPFIKNVNDSDINNRINSANARLMYLDACYFDFFRNQSNSSKLMACKESLWAHAYKDFKRVSDQITNSKLTTKSAKVKYLKVLDAQFARYHALFLLFRGILNSSDQELSNFK